MAGATFILAELNTAQLMGKKSIVLFVGSKPPMSGTPPQLRGSRLEALGMSVGLIPDAIMSQARRVRATIVKVGFWYPEAGNADPSVTNKFGISQLSLNLFRKELLRAPPILAVPISCIDVPGAPIPCLYFFGKKFEIFATDAQNSVASFMICRSRSVFWFLMSRSGKPPAVLFSVVQIHPIVCGRIDFSKGDYPKMFMICECCLATILAPSRRCFSVNVDTLRELDVWRRAEINAGR